MKIYSGDGTGRLIQAVILAATGAAVLLLLLYSAASDQQIFNAPA